MSLRRIIISLLVVCLSLIGLACGLLCLLCLIGYVLLHGLGVGSAVLALLCLSCLGLAVMLSGRAVNYESKRLGGARLRSLKTRWRSRNAGVAPALSAETDRGAYHLKPGSAGAPPPIREAENWPEDLRPYGEWSEPTDNVGASQNRER
jgi:hypothetical protein